MGVVSLTGGAAQLTLLARSEIFASGQEVAASGVAAFDLLRQPNLVVLGEQRVLPDVGQIEPDEIFLVPLDRAMTMLDSLARPTAERAERCGLRRPSVGPTSNSARWPSSRLL